MNKAIDGIIWEADADTLQFSRVAGSVDDILGYSAHDWLKEPGFWQSKLHPQDSERVIKTCQTASAQRLPHRLTYRMINAEGGTVWVQDNVKVTVEGDRATLTGIMIDVTEMVEQTRELAALNTQNNYFRALFDLVPVAIWEEDWTSVLQVLRKLRDQGVRDIQKHALQSPEFVEDMLSRLRVVSVNTAAVEMFRADSPEDLICRADKVFQADLPHSIFVTALDAVMRGDPRLEGVNTLRRLDGEPLHVMFRISLPDIDDPAPRVVICEMDITAAHIANERFELVTRATTDVIWDFDIVKNTLWASDGLKRIFGLEPETMFDSLEYWTERVHPDDLDRVMQRFDEILHHGRDEWEQDYRFRRGNDTYAVVRDEGFVLRDTAGRAVRLVGSLLDISAQRQMEEQMIQSQKLEAMGKLTGGVAHDFNNLLTIVLGSLEALEDRVSDDEVASRHVATAMHAVDCSTQLISQLLSYARKQPMAPQALDLVRQLSNASRMLERAVGESVVMSVRSEPGLWQAQADPSQLDNALLNLCINARDAMSGGGKLSIRARNTVVGSGDPLREKGLKAGRYVTISVADTGHGMDAATLRAAFDPFFTTKKVGAGSGLGLSMVYGFAHQSNGVVTIKSAVGEGTVVDLYLPAVEVEAASDNVNTTEAPKLAKGAGRILLVEDQDLVREHIVSVLERLGYSVQTADVAAKALTLLNSDPTIDMLLTDVVLPGGMSGCVLAETAHKFRPDLPVRFISGFSEIDAEGAEQLVAGQNLLRKPFRLRELADFVREAMHTP